MKDSVLGLATSFSFLRMPPPHGSRLFPYTTLFRSMSMLARSSSPLLVTIRDPDVVNASQMKPNDRSEEHTSELQSLTNLVCRLLPEKKNNYDGISRRTRSTRSDAIALEQQLTEVTH